MTSQQIKERALVIGLAKLVLDGEISVNQSRTVVGLSVLTDGSSSQTAPLETVKPEPVHGKCPDCTHYWTSHALRSGKSFCVARSIDASGNYDRCGCSSVAISAIDDFVPKCSPGMHVPMQKLFNVICEKCRTVLSRMPECKKCYAEDGSYTCVRMAHFSEKLKEPFPISAETLGKSYTSAVIENLRMNVAAACAREIDLELSSKPCETCGCTERAKKASFAKGWICAACGSKLQ